MPVLINFKICDNSKDCNGIAVCPTGAFHWDDKNRTVAVDAKKCVSCGKCEESCPVGAIRVAKTDKEYEKIRKEIDKDPRKVSDLFVDRYGAQPVSQAFLIPQSSFNVQIIESTKPAVIELFNGKLIKCMINSMPIRDLLKDENVKYRKIEVNEGDEMMKKYGVTKLPSLLFFKDGKMIGKIEGYYNLEQANELKKKADAILKKT